MCQHVLYCLVPTLVYFEVATREKTIYRINVLNGTRQRRQLAVAALPQQARMPGHGPQLLMRGVRRCTGCTKCTVHLLYLKPPGATEE